MRERWGSVWGRGGGAVGGGLGEGGGEEWSQHEHRLSRYSTVTGRDRSMGVG